jgi:putative membrane protein
MRKLAILLGGAIALAGCATQPAADAPVAAAAVVDPNNPLMAPGYMAMAASSDLFEIQSSQLAHQRAQSPAVHSMATMLITDHTRSTQTLMAAAASAGLTPPPPALLPPHQAMLDQLNAAGSGAAFDQAYQQIQVQAHTQALQLHQNYAASGDVPALRTAAAGLVPVIQAHLQHAQTMQVAAPAAMPAPMQAPPVRQPGERG